MEASSGKIFNTENKIWKRMRVGCASSYHPNSTVGYNRSNKLITLQKKNINKGGKQTQEACKASSHVFLEVTERTRQECK